jgi:hypothetical protein
VRDALPAELAVLAGPDSSAKTVSADVLIARHCESEVLLGAFQPPTLQSTVPRFRFRRMSPDPQSPLDTEGGVAEGPRGPGPRTATIMGIQLRHFGAFLKSEWRANDWMWGRLHGAHHLTHILLTKERLQRLKRVGQLDTGIVGLRKLLADEPHVDDIERALQGLGDPDGNIDAHLQIVRSAMVAHFQTQILCEELPKLACVAVGAAPLVADREYPDWVRALYDDGETPGAAVAKDKALAAFSVCRIAMEDSVAAFAATPEGKGDAIAAVLTTLRGLMHEDKLPGILKRALHWAEFDAEHAFTRHLTERLLRHLRH